MTDLLAGSTVKAGDFPPAQADSQTDSYSATSTSYTTATTAGTYNDCGVAFTAPTSGRVAIHTTARMTNSGANGTLVAPQVSSGSTIGAGTVFEAAADAGGVANYTGTFVRVGTTHMVTGLTAGSPYNVILLHRVVSGTGSFANREVIVQPLS